MLSIAHFMRATHQASMVRPCTSVCAHAHISRVFQQNDTLAVCVHMQPIPLYQKAGAGLAAGGLGALVGSPADLSLIRMQSDATLPPEKRRNYTGAPLSCERACTRLSLLLLTRPALTPCPMFTITVSHGYLHARARAHAMHPLQQHAAESCQPG